MANKYNKLFISTTDTILGIGGKVSKEVKDLIYEIKGRDRLKKLIILVGSIEQARKFKEWNTQAEEFAKKWWPGAYTLVVNDQGFRMPKQEKFLEYLKKNGPVYFTSCNISGAPVCETIEAAKEVFPEVTNVYNFGEMSGKASQVIRVETGEILRN
ncbi:tRNA A37 threonylcarbamoyladenosine synthetase subunit TsaC/SUA5/YrdC [Metamycoplasma subdolum]|uniref:L-threonylcarbamoyladenylate synthase n=1 Tax=Metamycoplasma subdolum TaxID=92407 RepID=A0A3L9ZZN8_9BACT|nr:Sua5/YciO/YrdC/YwlC family protein [Metamycoplasma subdolum]RMA77594.1 tRNA A37 threonylcarbamoyladenosine synthetase subunit TsaC/SUA5/YrdC [Metamycoplasma subdolum]WPB50388.1 Sua5/YciO/YrdC/YwlC family protein [Metamycoplasma subdolum]